MLDESAFPVFGDDPAAKDSMLPEPTPTSARASARPRVPTDEGTVTKYDQPEDNFPVFEMEPFEPPKPRSLLNDAARGFAGSAVGIAGAAVGAAEYAAGSGGKLTEWREDLVKLSASINDGMSPEMQTALQREFTARPSWMGGEGNSAWEGFGTLLGSAAAQTVATSGSLVAAAPAVIAAALAGPGAGAVAAATIVSFATGGALGAGTVWNDVATEFTKAPEAERLKNPTYARLRAEGVDQPSAINEAVREAAAGVVEASALGSAVINAATGRFLAALGTRKTGGIRAGALQGLKIEAPTEFLEEGLQQAMSLVGSNRALGTPVDPWEIAEGAVRGAIAGGALGAGAGAIGGAFADPAHVQALNPPDTTPPDTTPPDTTPPDTTPPTGAPAFIPPATGSAPAPPIPPTAPAPLTAPTAERPDFVPPPPAASDAAPPAFAPPSATLAPAPAPVAEPPVAPAAVQAPDTLPAAAAPEMLPPVAPNASPAAVAYAEKNGIDLTTIAGTGTVVGGSARINLADVLKATKAAPAPDSARAQPISASAPVIARPDSAPKSESAVVVDDSLKGEVAANEVAAVSPRVVRARKAQDPLLREITQAALDLEFGGDSKESFRESVDGLMKQIGDETQASIKDNDGKSFRDLEREYESGFGTRVNAWIQARKKQIADEESKAAAINAAANRKDMTRGVNESNIRAALEDQGGAVGKLMRSIARKDSKRYRAAYDSIEAVRRSMGIAEPEWLAELRGIVSGAKRGGNNKARSAATAAFKEKYKTLVALEESKEGVAQKTVEEVFAANAFEANESNDYKATVTRYKRMAAQLGKALNSRSFSGMSAKLGDFESKAHAIIEFAKKASKLKHTGGPGAREIIDAHRSIEAILAGGDFDAALELLAATRTEGSGTIGTGGTDSSSEDGTTKTKEQESETPNAEQALTEDDAGGKYDADTTQSLIPILQQAMARGAALMKSIASDPVSNTDAANAVVNFGTPTPLVAATDAEMTARAAAIAANKAAIQAEAERRAAAIAARPKGNTLSLGKPTAAGKIHPNARDSQDSMGSGTVDQARAAQMLEQVPPAMVYADSPGMLESLFPAVAATARKMAQKWGSRQALSGIMDNEVTGAFGGTALDQGLWAILARKLGQVPVFVYPDAVWNQYVGATATGMFMPNTTANVAAGQLPGVIVIPESLLTNPTTPYGGVAALRETMLHEFVHAGTFASLMTSTKTATKAKLDRLMAHVRAELKKRDIPISADPALAYAMNNGSAEFIAMALTNQSVRDFLLSVPLTPAQVKGMGLIGKIGNAFNGFVEWVREILGVPRIYTTALEAAIEIGEKAIMTPSAQSLHVAAFANPEVADEGAQFLKLVPNAVSDLIDRVTPHRIEESPLGNLLYWAKQSGLGFSTGRQMEIAGDSMFTRGRRLQALDPTSTAGPMRQVMTAHLRRSVLAQNYLKPYIAPVQALSNLSPKHNREISVFALDATLAEAHPDLDLTHAKNKHLIGNKPRQVRGRAQHAKLRDQWLNKLTPEQRAAYSEMVATTSQGVATIGKALVEMNVDRWWIHQVDTNLDDLSKMPIQFADLAGLRQRAVDDTMTDIDKQMLGDEWMALMVEARKRNTLDGPYIPLQRFGDFVVTWKENAPETLVFDSEQEANDHIENSDYDPVGDRLTKTYYDAAGAEITAPDPALLQGELGAALTAAGPQITSEERAKITKDATRAALKATRDRDAKRTTYTVRQQIEGVSFFEKRSEAYAFQRELQESGARDVSMPDRRMRPAEKASLLGDAAFDKIKQAVERDTTVPEAYRKSMLDALGAAMLMAAPSRTVNASLVRRRKVRGASQNVVRAISNYGIAVANFAAEVQTSLPILTGLKEMNSEIREKKHESETDRRRAYLEEIEQRLTVPPLNSGGGAVSRAVRTLQSLAYVFFLASPSYALIQMTQPWMLSMPVLGARYGMARGAAALAKANSDIGFGAVMKAGGKDAMAAMRTFVTGAQGVQQPTLAGVKTALMHQRDGAALVQMLEELEKEGLVDGDAGLELIRAELSEEWWARKKLGQLESLTRAIPAAIEVINRTSTAVAAYRLAIKAGKTHEAATLEAREVVDMTQADYSSANTARYMDPRRYPWLAPMMTFRKYAQAMYALFIRQTYLSVKGKSRDERVQAVKTLTYVLGAHAMVAGALGLPTEVFGVALGVVALVFGGDGEPWDWETEIRQALAAAVGPEAAEVITRGLPRAAGVDLHGRMGLNTLIFMNDMRDYQQRTMMEYVGNLLLGAPGSMLTSALAAPQLMAQGDTGKAIETIMPKGIRDALKAHRFAEEGVTTRKGERIDGGQDMGVAEILTQSLGFTPARVAETYERRNAVQGANRQVGNKRATLMRRYRLAEPGDRADIWREIIDFNRSLPPAGRADRITRANLIASMREANRRSGASGQEDYLPKGREYLRREGDFAVTR